MSRFFNTAGPVNARDHYCLSPTERIHLDEILLLIEQKKYFVLHAPRQTGKTSSLLALQTHLNASGRYCCLYGNVEAAQAARENVPQAIQAILNDLAERASAFAWGTWLAAAWPEILARSGPYAALGSALTRLAQEAPLPTVLLLDEIDSLVGDTLIAVLRQIRGGYDKRPEHFPQTIMLCGVRDVRDYRLEIEKLLAAFQQFFREHSAHWVERFDYKEAGPQLLLQAFLQRILNGGGRIEREYGLGRQRTDLLVIWPYADQAQRVVLALKIQHKSLDDTVQQGLEQTWKYMDTCGTADGHLIIFNRDPAVSWDAKIFRQESEYQGHRIVIWGM